MFQLKYPRRRKKREYSILFYSVSGLFGYSKFLDDPLWGCCSFKERKNERKENLTLDKIKETRFFFSYFLLYSYIHPL